MQKLDCLLVMDFICINLILLGVNYYLEIYSAKTTKLFKILQFISSLIFDNSGINFTLN